MDVRRSSSLQMRVKSSSLWSYVTYPSTDFLQTYSSCVFNCRKNSRKSSQIWKRNSSLMLNNYGDITSPSFSEYENGSIPQPASPLEHFPMSRETCLTFFRFSATKLYDFQCGGMSWRRTLKVSHSSSCKVSGWLLTFVVAFLSLLNLYLKPQSLLISALAFLMYWIGFCPPRWMF